MLNALDRIRVVLVEPTESGNIGASARAMKTMGLRRLHLVNPRRFPHGDASRMAVSAGDLLDTAVVHSSLAAGLQGCDARYGVSARQRRVPLPVLGARDAAVSAIASASAGDVALVFGNEDAGLSNEDLSLCETLVQIPSSDECRSLNLAAAVQVLCYELRMACLSLRPAPLPRVGAPREVYQGLFSQLNAALNDAGYFGNKNPALAAEKLQRMLLRGQWDRAEIAMFRGVVARLTNHSGRRKP